MTKQRSEYDVEIYWMTRNKEYFGIKGDKEKNLEGKKSASSLKQNF